MNIFWQYPNRKLVKGLSDPVEPVELFMAARDIVPITLALVDRTSIADAFTAETLTEDDDLIIALKETTNSASNLAYEADWTYNADADAPRYTAELDLNTAALIAAMGSRDRISVFGGLAITRTIGGELRHLYSTQFKIVIENDVVRDDTVAPAPSAKYKDIDGVLHIYNSDQSKFIPILSQGSADEQHVDLGTGVDA